MKAGANMKKAISLTAVLLTASIMLTACSDGVTVSDNSGSQGVQSDDERAVSAGSEESALPDGEIEISLEPPSEYTPESDDGADGWRDWYYDYGDYGGDKTSSSDEMLRPQKILCTAVSAAP